MKVHVRPSLRAAERRLPFECIALVLQGEGALGAISTRSRRTSSGCGSRRGQVPRVGLQALARRSGRRDHTSD